MLSISFAVSALLACGEVREYRVTAYCDRGVTASGFLAGPGTCAAPAGVPFGSVVFVPALRSAYVVTDRTAIRFRHNTVDVWRSTRRECFRVGASRSTCVVWPARRPIPYQHRHRYYQR